MLRSLKTILCGLLLSLSALIVVADEVKKYQEPTQAEKNTAKERITEQLKEAEVITQDADYQKIPLGRFNKLKQWRCLIQCR